MLSLLFIILGNFDVLDEPALKENLKVTPVDIDFSDKDNQTLKFFDNEVPVPRRIPGDFDLETDLPEDFSKKLIFKNINFGKFGNGILLTGEISEGDAARFQNKINSLSSNRIQFIALNSPGGDVYDALEIGRAVRQANLETIIPDFASCFSACPLIFASGVARYKSANSYIGVHQQYYEDDADFPVYLAVEDIQKSQAQAFKHLKKMGVKTDIIEHILNTPPEEIYILNNRELKEFNLVTKFVGLSKTNWN